MKVWVAKLVMRNEVLVLAETADKARQVLSPAVAIDALLEGRPHIESIWSITALNSMPTLSPKDSVYSADHTDLRLQEALAIVEAAAERAKIDAHNAEVLKNQLQLFPQPSLETDREP